MNPRRSRKVDPTAVPAVPGGTAATALVERFRRSTAFSEVQKPKLGEVILVHGLFGASKALFLSALRVQDDRSILLCCADELELEDWREDLALFSTGAGSHVTVLPELERDEDSRPLATSLLARQTLLESLGKKEVLLADLASLMGQVAHKGQSSGERIKIRVGQQVDPRELQAKASRAGLRQVPQVLLPGELSLRGDVLDIHPPGLAAPLRIEFFDDEVDSIRRFDPVEQSSTEVLDEASFVLPVPQEETQACADSLPFPLDLLEPKHTIVIVIEAVRFEEQFSRFTLSEGTITPPVQAFRKGIQHFAAYSLSTLPAKGSHGCGCEAPRLPAIERGDLKGRILASGQLEERLLVVLHSEPEVQRLLRLAKETIGGPDIGLDAVVGSLSRGFRCRELERVLLNHGEFFGTGIARRRVAGKTERHKISSKAIESFFELEEGDLVVHAVHGIARFVGLERTTRGTSKGEEDHLRLQFADEIEVLVPASKIDLIQKYVGSGQASPKLDKLGSRSFAKRKAQVAQALHDLSAELLEVQVRRANSVGFSCPTEDPLCDEFIRTFPYEDTPDQAKASLETMEDLVSTRPMDRLLCGDVGFGKTEIAMRAAFRVASAGRQAAVLVPTTLLADQHGRTFRDRMASFPLVVEVYSRLQNPKEKKRILAELAAGRVDIIIGTHALLGKRVRFADLGLLIVDEEQRFGVAHKERIRSLRANIDVLTLTATPIPRTLHMALLGIKDISTLATPPPGRMEIATKVVHRSSAVIRDAIRAELRRGGQVFFLHNRVQSIQVVLAELQSLVPEARYVVGHGQMNESELLSNMKKFLDADADVLLTTSIVQSGLDIPRANTIIVDRADRFGLSELHQLRGRVGRDITHAHCFLMTDPSQPLSHEARSRLAAMERFTALGSGFSIAMRDLEIRGAGNLLGAEQSGHIAAIGYDMYCRLLQGAMERVGRGQHESGELPELLLAGQVDVDLGVDAFLPESFVGNRELRLGLLREMDQAMDEGSQRKIHASLADRYGRLPQEVENLLSLFLVKHLLGAQGMSAARFLPPDQIVLSHDAGRGPRGQWLRAFLDVRPVSPVRTHLVLPSMLDTAQEVLRHLEDALKGREHLEKLDAHDMSRQPARRRKARGKDRR